MRTRGISTDWKPRLKSKLRRANWRAPSSLLMRTRAWTSLRESPLVSKRTLVSRSSIWAAFFSVGAGVESLPVGLDCWAEAVRAQIAVARRAEAIVRRDREREAPIKV